MKIFIKICGIILSVALILFGLVYFFILKLGITLDKESKKFAQDVSVQFTQTWDINQLKSNSAPELIEILNNDPKVAEKLITTFSTRLGRLKSLSNLRGESLVTLTNKRQDITATYQGDAVFEKGDGQIIIRLINRNGEWKILNFKINSNALLQ